MTNAKTNRTPADHSSEPGVAFDAEVVQDGPGCGDSAARAATGERGRTVEAAGPVASGEELMASQLTVAVEDDGSAAGGVAVLVEVGGDRGYAVDPEVPGSDRTTEALDEREEVAAEAGVYVAEDAAPGGKRGDLGDRVDDAEGVAGR